MKVVALAIPTRPPSPTTMARSSGNASMSKRSKPLPKPVTLATVKATPRTG